MTLNQLRYFRVLAKTEHYTKAADALAISQPSLSRAIALLECIPAEENKYTRPWIAAGVNPRNAFDTQGLIQLSREYCAAQRCECCPVARRIIDKITRSQ